MKAVVRRIDKLGRIVLPVDFRKALSLSLEDEVILNIAENEIVLKKQECSCRICGSALTVGAEVSLCRACAEIAMKFYSGN